MEKIRVIIGSIVAVLLIGALIAWKLSSNKKEMEKDAAVATIKTSVYPVTVVLPKLQKLDNKIAENGVFKPLKQLNFLSESSGRVLDVQVKKGQFIHANEMIAQLDNKQIRIDLDLAKKTLAKNLSDMEKFEKMLTSNAVNAQQVADQRLTIANSEANVSTLKRKLNTTVLLAPISGYINELNIEVGTYLSPGTPIAEIVDISSLKMEVMLLDKDVAKIRNGQSVDIKADLYPNDVISGKVTSIASVGDAARKFGVEVTLPNQKTMLLKAGMTGKARFDFKNTKEALFIPGNCIVGSIQDAKVFVINGDKVSLRPIVVGSSLNENIEVISGLLPTDQVVTSGQLNIIDGSPISIIK